MHLHSDLQNFSCWESEPIQNRLPMKLNRGTISLCAQTFTKWVKLSYLLTTHLWIVASQFSVDSFSITMSSVPHNPKNNLCAKSTHLYLLSINEVKEELSHRLTSEKILTEIMLYFDSSSLYCLCCFYSTFEIQLSPSSLSFSFSNPPPRHHSSDTQVFTEGLDTNAMSWLHFRIGSKVQSVINISCASLLWALGKEPL